MILTVQGVKGHKNCKLPKFGSLALCCLKLSICFSYLRFERRKILEQPERKIENGRECTQRTRKYLVKIVVESNVVNFLRLTQTWKWIVPQLSSIR